MPANKARLNNREAAAHLGLSPETLKLSRHTGRLCGVRTPAYRKMGRHVVYDLSTLDEWLEQFPEQPHTAA